MKPPKISPCPSCRSADGPGILEGISLRGAFRAEGVGLLNSPRRSRFRVGCPCGAIGPWAVSVRRAIEVWNDRSL